MNDRENILNTNKNLRVLETCAGSPVRMSLSSWSVLLSAGPQRGTLQHAAAVITSPLELLHRSRHTLHMHHRVFKPHLTNQERAPAAVWRRWMDGLYFYILPKLVSGLPHWQYNLHLHPFFTKVRPKHLAYGRCHVEKRGYVENMSLIGQEVKPFPRYNDVTLLPKSSSINFYQSDQTGNTTSRWGSLKISR